MTLTSVGRAAAAGAMFASNDEPDLGHRRRHGVEHVAALGKRQFCVTVQPPTDRRSALAAAAAAAAAAEQNEILARRARHRPIVSYADFHFLFTINQRYRRTSCSWHIERDIVDRFSHVALESHSVLLLLQLLVLIVCQSVCLSRFICHEHDVRL